MSLERLSKQKFKHLDRMGATIESEILKAYKSSLRVIRNTLSEYASKYELTMIEMQKYNRLQGLEKDVVIELRKLKGKTSSKVMQGLQNIYEEGYYRTAFEIERSVQAKLSFSKLNKTAIRRAIENPLMNLAIDRNRNNVIVNINQAISQGLIRGSSYLEISKGVKEALEQNANNALRIARTETHRVQVESTFDSMKHAENIGVKFKKRWLSTLDRNTRDSHQSLDGEEVGLDEKFSNGLLYPGDPAGEPSEIINCRCEMIQVVSGYEPEFRRSRREGIIPYTNYREWKENRLVG